MFSMVFLHNCPLTPPSVNKLVCLGTQDYLLFSTVIGPLRLSPTPLQLRSRVKGRADLARALPNCDRFPRRFGGSRAPLRGGPNTSA